MFDFLFGYVLGSATRDGPRMSARSVGIVILLLMALTGIGWFTLGAITADKPLVACGGTAVQDSYCLAMANAKQIGIIILGAVFGLAGLVVLWSLITKLKKS